MRVGRLMSDVVLFPIVSEYFLKDDLLEDLNWPWKAAAAAVFIHCNKQECCGVLVHVEMRVISQGGELYLNPGGTEHDDDEDLERRSDEEGWNLLLIFIIIIIIIITWYF